jgi:hypothetical protein
MGRSRELLGLQASCKKERTNEKFLEEKNQQSKGGPCHKQGTVLPLQAQTSSVAEATHKAAARVVGFLLGPSAERSAARWSTKPSFIPMGAEFVNSRIMSCRKGEAS